MTGLRGVHGPKRQGAAAERCIVRSPAARDATLDRPTRCCLVVGAGSCQCQCQVRSGADEALQSGGVYSSTPTTSINHRPSQSPWLLELPPLLSRLLNHSVSRSLAAINRGDGNQPRHPVKQDSIHQRQILLLCPRPFREQSHSHLETVVAWPARHRIESPLESKPGAPLQEKYSLLFDGVVWWACDGEPWARTEEGTEVKHRSCSPRLSFSQTQDGVGCLVT